MQMKSIQLKPHIEANPTCPRCHQKLASPRVLWQGIHVCVEAQCPNCQAEIISDLPVGHARQTPYQVELRTNSLFGNAASPRRWFGMPLLASLQQPKSTEITLKVERLHEANQVIILNCLDFLYGHTLLKLLNAETHLREQGEFGLVVLIPPFLRWLVPAGVAEIWTVELPLAQAQNYYPELHQRIVQECARFDTIYLSTAHSHPSDFDIIKFTREPRHSFNANRFRITFIWREDRPWWNHELTLRVARRLNQLWLLRHWQTLRVRRLFKKLRSHFPQATFTVAGLGRSTRFPNWIDDQRVVRYTEAAERAMCRVYSESRLVLGVHGSSLLLPSALAGITIDLMPNERWPNLAQDILYQPSQAEDVRLTAWRHQYIPLSISNQALTRAIIALIENYNIAERSFLHYP